MAQSLSQTAQKRPYSKGKLLITTLLATVALVGLAACGTDNPDSTPTPVRVRVTPTLITGSTLSISILNTRTTTTSTSALAGTYGQLDTTFGHVYDRINALSFDEDGNIVADGPVVPNPTELPEADFGLAR